MKTIAFIIPLYNEEKRLRKTFLALKSLRLPSYLKLEEIIFVDDGSIDKSKIKIQRSKILERYNTTCIHFTKNMGKGYAVRQGMLAANADYAIFFDADMSTPLSELEGFVPFMHDGVDVIVGTRKHKDSEVLKHQPFFRAKLGEGFTRLTNLMLGLTVSDYTCGFKAFSRVARILLFSHSRVNRWGFDAEILLLSHKMYLSIREVPVNWTNDAHTKVRLLRDVPHSFWELCKIIWFHRIQPSFSTVKLHLPTVQPSK
jgi:dolichyl-phosphate beta-glucosyltransferase